jgi:hypothetical protein
VEELKRKLQYKETYKCLVLNMPDDWREFIFTFDTHPSDTSYDIEIIFIKADKTLLKDLSRLKAASDDRIRWLAYPKKGGKLGTDLNRDGIVGVLSTFNFNAVAMISINDEWSAIRIRPAGMVKRMIHNDDSFPQELELLLRQCTECRNFFDSLSNTNKKEYIRWISSAKRPETKQVRLDKTKMLLQDKVPNPFYRP